MNTLKNKALFIIKELGLPILWHWMVVNLGFSLFMLVVLIKNEEAMLVIPTLIVSSIGSFPAYVVVLITIGWWSTRPSITVQGWTVWHGTIGIIALLYGILAQLISGGAELNDVFPFNYPMIILVPVGLFACNLLGLLVSYSALNRFFSFINHSNMQDPLVYPTAETDAPEQTPPAQNKILIKGLVTAALILFMMVPTVFIHSLIEERQSRQKEVVLEVSSKWAAPQVISTPYLYIPYKQNIVKANGTIETVQHYFILLPEELGVQAQMTPEQRQRSIYKVELYRAKAQMKGYFNLKQPSALNNAVVLWQEAKICMGITDFKGWESRVKIQVNGQDTVMMPGLPVTRIDPKGMSTSLALNPNNPKVDFSLQGSWRGSTLLHFIPLAGNSHFTIQSACQNPSFDGATLPTERKVNDSSFEAQWHFNEANLPFSTVIDNQQINAKELAFGLSLVTPADHYTKTLRSVKYALLVIGLSFAAFFLIELLQKKSFHPIQYVLVGIALAIFYTLLLSISEFLGFDTAYMIASVATVSLIGWYTFTHFKKISVALSFAGVLSALYAAIFMLIRLEDTALLVGSIGLFFLLALAMYISRKIKFQ